jgi:2-methylcitrate dehydratase PrpD
MVPLESAALCNGIAAHVLDYDDVTPVLRGHASVALWPALSALAEAMDADSARLASAYVVGFEVLCGLARGMAVGQYARGWHTTASIGVLGCTAGCAHLLGLDPRQTVNALGLAVAQAGGVRQNVGTQAKSFQAGQCNAAALRAVLLAREGFEASADALDGEFGYLDLYGAGMAAALPGELGHVPLELERSGLDVKKYPMCYATHRALDGLLALKHGHAIDAAQVRAVQVRASAGALVPLVHPRPSTGLEGKFSMQYAVAAALLDGAVRLASFTDAAVCRPEAAELMARTSVAEVDGDMFPKWSEVEIELRDGRTLVQRVEQLGGSQQAPLTDADLREKAADCLQWAGRKQRDARRLWDVASKLGRISSGQLFEELRLGAWAAA